MKSYSICLIIFAAVVIVSIIFAGCATNAPAKNPAIIIRDNKEMPMLQIGSPLKGVSPKTFAFKEFKDVIGKGPYELRFESGRPVTAFVAMTIMKELERNGHTCIAYSPQSKVDFIVEGSVYKFGFTSPQAPFEVAVKLTVEPVSPGKEIFIKAYEGKSYKGQDAWLPMVKEISTDPDLIAFLEK